jgi:hypothetical protein
MDNPFRQVNVSPHFGRRRLRKPRTTLAPAVWRSRALRLEPLEARLTLAGNVTQALGTIPAGAMLTVAFDVTVDSAIPKGDTSVKNQATVTGTSLTQTITNVVDTTIDRAPQVTGVYVRGSGWTNAFKDHLHNAMLGDIALGYRLATGADQLKPLPWVGINAISMTFSETPSSLGIGSLSVFGSGGPIGVSTFSMLGTQATWTLSTPLGADKIRLVLDDSVTDATGQALDGEWIDGTAVMPSGNGTPGSDFSFRFNTLPGDGTQNGAVSITDIVNMNSRAAVTTTGNADGTITGNYTIFFDINGDSSVSSADVSNTTPHLPSILPAGEPLSAPANGAGSDRDLTEIELNSVAAAAIDRLAIAGVTATQLSLLKSVHFQIVDLASAQLGAAGAGVVQIDINGAGHGYFVDDSPLDDSEFELLAAGGGFQADAGSAAFGRIDLLSVVLHELGHILGYDHGDEDGLLGETLETGVRHADLDELFANEEALAAVLEV